MEHVLLARRTAQHRPVAARMKRQKLKSKWVNKKSSRPKPRMTKVPNNSLSKKTGQPICLMTLIKALLGNLQTSSTHCLTNSQAKVLALDHQ